MALCRAYDRDDTDFRPKSAKKKRNATMAIGGIEPETITLDFIEMGSNFLDKYIRPIEIGDKIAIDNANDNQLNITMPNPQPSTPAHRQNQRDFA